MPHGGWDAAGPAYFASFPQNHPFASGSVLKNRSSCSATFRRPELPGCGAIAASPSPAFLLFCAVMFPLPHTVDDSKADTISAAGGQAIPPTTRDL